uniref:Salivary secreted peptide n=1 Tax=Glossina morsitans morsitans TaxID=37546 RepID=A0A1B0GCN0_GLOMM
MQQHFEKSYSLCHQILFLVLVVLLHHAATILTGTTNYYPIYTNLLFAYFDSNVLSPQVNNE